jgi:bifunctional UDP-N-acetylglucosamine pyrophosphorylase / glucosamine-1-phosphate N-acetyltransferase
MKKNIQAIILAAGKSTRFNTEKTKLAEPLCGQALILFPTKLLEQCAIPTTVVVGYQQETIKNIITTAHGTTMQFVTQEKQEGTGHALAVTKHLWHADHILVMNADAPLVTEETINSLYDAHIQQNATISFVTACSPDPLGKAYGRIVKKEHFIEIIEAKDFNGDPHEHCCINAGIYVIKKDFLINHIETLNDNNANKEFYITDLVKIASHNTMHVATISAPFDTIRGVNTLQELWAAEQIKRSDLIKYWMEHGVRFSLAQNIHIDLNVSIGKGTYIGSGVHLFGATTIGKNCTIKEFSSLDNVTIGDAVTIYQHCLISDTQIDSGAFIGPFAHLRDTVHIGQNAAIGNFVEIKNSVIGAESKAKHLTYLGDATVGSRVNIGAGTITCNYDGVDKHATIIKNNTFIGSNNALIAPITIGENAFTAAGSTITDDVPDNALAIARSCQINKLEYAHKLRKQTAAKKNDLQHESPIKTSDNDFSFVGARMAHHDTSADEQ